MRPLNILYCLLIYLTGADALRVTMRKPLIGALREENVTIPCDISDYGKDRTVAVYWTRTLNGSRHEVYHYETNKIAYRPGSYMVESEIYGGNAELHIPRVQFSDEGEYTCTVIVTPDSVDGKSTLQVLARPSASLTPGDISILLGTEKSVMCEATNYYPQPVTIRWVRYNKGSSSCVALDRGICTTDAVTNGDNTFNVTSHLTLSPTTIGDDGNKYSCIVTHGSLETELRINFTLTVTEQEDNTGAVAGAVIGTLLSTLLLVFAGFFCCKRFKKDPPSLSEIAGNEEMIDMTRTTLTCQIMNFRPNDIEISVCLRRGENMINIHTWRSRDRIPPARMMGNDSTGGSRVVIGVEEQQGLINGAANHAEKPLRLELVPVLKTSRLGTSSCQCSIHITPSIAEDNRAELYVRVAHPALRSPVSVWRTLNVIGVPPKQLTIMAPEHLTHDEMVTLTCPINGFRPRVLSITWLRKDQDQETELVTWDCTGTKILDEKYSHNVKEITHEDTSFSCISALRMKPNVSEDQGVKYVCRTHHPATAQTAEQELDMVVTACPVLGTIKRTQKTLPVGDQMDLSCKINSFYPAQIHVTWYMVDGTVIPSHTSNALPENNGLYYVTSTMKFRPTIKDLEKTFRCEVQHDSLVVPRSITYTLSDLISAPSISDITCDPKYPEIGRPVTLSCTVSDMYPGSCTVQWYKGLTKRSEEEHTEKIHQDLESGTFHGATELSFMPNNGDHNADFHMMITHGAKTITRTFALKLRGIPTLSKITSDPDKVSYGKPLTLRCNVTTCRREDITVDWLEDNKPLEGPRGSVTRVQDTICCTLNITATALVSRKVYICSVKHKDIAEAFTSNIYVTLPDNPPSLSDINVQPAKPKPGKETSFTATISGFSPQDIEVRWYKGYSTFPGNAVTSSKLWIGTDSLYTCTSTLRFTPEPIDHNTSIRCEVTHAATKTVREKQYSLTGVPDPVSDHGAGSRNTAQSPRDGRKSFKIRGIGCLTDSPRVGDDVTLRCNVDGCNADDCEFFWYNGAFPVDGKTGNGDLEDGSGSFSTVTFRAQESDRSCTIRFEACYNYQTIEETFTLRLGEQDKI